ncbi:MAG: hypothetical protein JSR61_20600 [Proteobacteria bacterium]|nr:hypothetical protein [Pseudomonadota bacterium]
MKTKTVILIFLGLLVAMTAGSVYLALTTERAQKSIVSVPAPDGKYKAVRLRVSGTRPEPYCVDSIAVYLSVYPDSFAASERNYEVYGGVCPPAGKRDALPKIEWTGNNSLRITYAVSDPAKPPRLKAKDASLFVDITGVKAD